MRGRAGAGRFFLARPLRPGPSPDAPHPGAPKEAGYPPGPRGGSPGPDPGAWPLDRYGQAPLTGSAYALGCTRVDITLES
jgi:hypothetical protein